MGNRTTLTAQATQFLESYYRHTQRMMYAFAKRLATASNMPTEDVTEAVQSAYARFAERLATDPEYSTRVANLVTNPSKISFWFIDSGLRKYIAHELYAQRGEHMMVDSLEGNFPDVTGTLTFGQDLRRQILGQEWQKPEYEDTDQSLSAGVSLRRLDQQFFDHTSEEPFGLNRGVSQAISDAKDLTQVSSESYSTHERQHDDYPGAPVTKGYHRSSPEEHENWHARNYIRLRALLTQYSRELGKDGITAILRDSEIKKQVGPRLLSRLWNLLPAHGNGRYRRDRVASEVPIKSEEHGSDITFQAEMLRKELGLPRKVAMEYAQALPQLKEALYAGR